MQTRPITTDLPVAHFREIGRIIVTWARIEYGLKLVAYEILGIDPKRGRIAVREPRPRDYPAFFSDILLARGLKPPPQLKTLGKKIQLVEDMRNCFAHSVWVKGTSRSRPILQYVAGSWEPNEEKVRIKRKIKPEGLPVPAEDLRGVINALGLLERHIEEACEAIVAALATSPQKPPAPGQ